MSGHGEKVYVFPSKPLDSSFSDEEIARRRDDVIRRMANTPPKPHSATKLGKRKPKSKTSPSKDGGRPKVAKES
jgi:hypothetical protein